MSAAAVIALIQALINGVPRLIEAIKKGRNLADVRVGEFVSKDALEKVKQANERADDYIENG
jgi:hypothetical protein